MSHVVDRSEQLLAWFAPWSSCAVALSGGVDSAVVASAAYRALGEQALAFTGDSPSLARQERQAALDVARRIGIRHQVLATQEFASDAYRRNAPDRCYHCKTELYQQIDQLLERLRPQLDVEVVVNGANADDLKDYRPGMRAAREHEVRSPLAECGFTKDDVRELARLWELPVWDKPASPCLSSRVAYGEEVTEARLAMIEQAEAFLRGLGFEPLRVRYHRGDLARIEVSADQVTRLCQEPVRAAVTAQLRDLGFQFVTIDLAGFRSGSLNAFVPLDVLQGDSQA